MRQRVIGIVAGIVAVSAAVWADAALVAPAPTEVTVRFVGNRALSSGELQAAMLDGVEPRALLDEDRRDRGVLLVTSRYYDHGYLKVEVDPARLTRSIDGRRATVTVTVREGDQYRLGPIDARGELLRSRDEALRLLGATQGEIFNRSKLAAGVLKVSDQLRNAGYAYSEALPMTTIDAAARTVAIALEVKRGPLTHISSVRVLGVEGAAAARARALLKVREGDLFSVTALEASKAALLGAGRFPQVDVSTQAAPGRPDGILINFEISEQPR